MASPCTWRILRSLGGGGMGSVWLAETPEGATVALKILTADAESLAREFAVLSRLRHPHIVSVRGFSPTTIPITGREEGPCLWMDYVEGRPLIEASKDVGVEAVLKNFEQALEALAYLHGQGIVHGDLSPGNLFVDEQGRLKLLDFGLSSSLLRADAHALGAATIPYAAPERLMGKATASGDLFSLGVVFYEALAGVHPRSGARNLKDLVEGTVRSLADVRPSLAKTHGLAARIIDRLLEADPARRFASAGDVLRALRGDDVGAAPAAATAVLRTIGPAAALLKEAVRRLEDRSDTVWLAVHGHTGVGKGRFLRELSIEAALRGQADRLQLFRDLHAASDGEMAQIAGTKRLILEKPQAFVVLHWNDDLLGEGRRDYLQSLLQAHAGQDIALENLDRDATRELLMAALGETPSEKAVENFFRQTDGNPRLLLEMVASYRDAASRTPRPKLDAWLKGLPRLHSLEAILRERLTALEPDEKRRLEMVAAAHFPTNLPGENLRGLEDRGLLVHEAGLVRLTVPSLEDAVLSALPAKAIRELHNRWLEVMAETPDSDVQKLHHALATGRDDIALRGARTAAESLQTQARYADALDLVERSLKIIGDRDERSRLLRIKMNLLNTLGRYEDALAVAEDWRALDASDEPKTLRTVKYWLSTGLYLQAAGRQEEAADRFRRCLQTGDEGDAAARPFLTRACTLLGVSLMRAGRLEDAAGHFERGLSLAPSTGRERAEILRNLAELAAADRRWDDASALSEEAVRLYEAAGYPAGVFSTHLQWGNFLLDRDDLAGAGSAYARAEAVARSQDRPLDLALVWANQSRLARLKGRLGDALESIAHAEDYFRLTGQSDDLEEAFKHHALALADTGRFADAESLLKRIGSPDRAREVRQALENPPAWPPSRLRSVYETLPPDLQVHFVERADWKRLESPEIPEYNEPEENPMPATTIAGKFLDDFADLNLTLLEEDDMDRVLGRLMDAGLRLGRAENGLLLIQSDNADGPLPGFSVAVARNVDAAALEREDYTASLSAVRRAMKTGQAVVTDNALQDPAFRDAKSVQMRGIRSILALPVPGDRGPAAVFYLDHRLEEGLFQGDHLAVLKAFATVAALAFQKGRMIERLKARNTELAHEIEIKDSEMGHLQREVLKSRQILKKEYGDIIGRSPKMLKVLSLVDRITDSKVPVWIFGESGTGKEAIARALHFNSPRAKKAFVSENCSALPEALLESELFGHKKGAFTHAVADKKGLLQHADGGTIFLDEIADMSLSLQAKLLRFLQEGEVRPIGSTQVLKVDARVVSASNKDLAQLVAEGKFREDLFFRLNGVTVFLPPLRERREDIALLSEHFLKKIAEREDKKPLHVAPETMKLFLKFDWPGNIRELQNTLETASLFAERSLITPDSLDFKPALRNTPAARPTSPEKSPVRPQPPAKADQAEVDTIDPELERILRAIRDESFNRTNAAKALGMSRRNLYVKLEKFGVPRDDRTLRDFVDRYVH